MNTPNSNYLDLIPGKHYLYSRMPTISKGLTQAYELQDFTHSAAIALKEGLAKEGKLNVTREDAQAICSLVKAWEACQERIRIHRNKPMPGSLRPVAKPKKVRTVSTKPLEQLPSEPLSNEVGDRQGGNEQSLSSTIVSTPVRTERAQDKSMLKQSIVEPEGSLPSAPGIPLE